MDGVSLISYSMLFIFFFQAEDGIRDVAVTGVQTCALPISLLVIGNKNYSSWSLRPWIAMRVLKLDFQEVRIPLYGPGARQEILRYSPSGKVPCLVDGASRVWDSLAILEYLAEKHPLWPDDPLERAQARSVCAEMHAGFPKLREHMSMNVRKRYPGRGRTPEVLAEIDRVVEIWSKCRQPFLFGAFEIGRAHV